MPKAWTNDAARCKAAAIPEDVKFAMKLQLGRCMLQRAFAAGIEANWVAGDSVYGNDSQMRSWLDQRRRAYILGVTAQLRLWTGEQRQWASEVVKGWPNSKWRQLSCGAGSKGERVYEWANMVIRNGWQRWLLARRSLSDRNEVSYYVVGGPKQTQIEEMARVAGARWAIEESFETAKGEVGLDHYEVRSWTGWYRHITLAMLAHAYLTVMRSKSADEAIGVEKKGRRKKSRIQKN